jgi:hypothetical protein
MITSDKTEFNRNIGDTHGAYRNRMSCHWNSVDSKFWISLCEIKACLVSYSQLDVNEVLPERNDCL